jgi:hypothetical protein
MNEKNLLDRLLKHFRIITDKEPDLYWDYTEEYGLSRINQRLNKALIKYISDNNICPIE